MDDNFQAEIQKAKDQLKVFLSRIFLDSSLLLGFVTITQQSFQKRIIDNFEEYLSSSAFSQGPNQAESEFYTIKYVEQVWSEFHHPVVKYFQSQHAEFYDNVKKEFKKCQQDGRKFNVKSVEARKIHENLLKYLKSVSQFYMSLLRHFCTQFENPYMPNDIVKAFGFSLAENAEKVTSPNANANHLFLVHKFLLSLGDLHRYRTFMETSFIIPCLSLKEFFKQKEIAKSETWGPKYERAVQFYRYCILLLPALNEPYNHIGMIHNHLDDKFSGCLWLLRSQFTRLPEYKLGLANLENIMSKNWFVSQLKGERVDLNAYLMCLVGYFYLPEVYKRGPNIIKETSFSKLESKLFKAISEDFKKHLSTRDFFIDQLTILFGFNVLIDNDKFSTFAFRYVERILDCVSTLQSCTDAEKANFLMTLRFILAWVKENKMVYKIFSSRNGTIEKLASLLNSLLSGQAKITDASPDVYEISSQEATEHLKSGSRPTRSFYFEEDVKFRDCSLIKFQFKDFKDEHLFTAENTNVLLGDYSSYVKNSDIPSFLDNKSVARIGISQDREDNIEREILRYKNNLRTIAILVSGKKIIDGNSEVSFDAIGCRFVINGKEKEKKGAQLNKKAKIGEKKANKANEIGDQRSNKELGDQSGINELGDQNGNKEIGDQNVPKEFGDQKGKKKTKNEKKKSSKRKEAKIQMDAQESSSDMVKKRPDHKPAGADQSTAQSQADDHVTSASENFTPAASLNGTIEDIQSVIASHASQLIIDKEPEIQNPRNPQLAPHYAPTHMPPPMNATPPPMPFMHNPQHPQIMQYGNPVMMYGQPPMYPIHPLYYSQPQYQQYPSQQCAGVRSNTYPEYRS